MGRSVESPCGLVDDIERFCYVKNFCFGELCILLIDRFRVAKQATMRKLPVDSARPPWVHDVSIRDCGVSMAGVGQSLGHWADR